MKNIFTLLTLILLIAGCSTSLEQIQTTPTVGQVSTPISIATVTPIPTTTLTYTTTPLPQPTKTKIPTSTPALTKTPLPTLESLEAEKVVQQYLRDNRGCKLPCWWGITPGQTTQEEAETFFGPIGRIEKSDHEERISFHHQFLDAPEGAGIYSSLYFKHGKVSHIYVWESGTSRSFTLSKLLSNYGKPDEIKIQVYREVFDGYPTFTMLLIYRAQGIVAEYLTVAEKEGLYIKGCFQSGVEYGRGPQLWLFDTNDQDLADLDFFIPRTKVEPISPPVLSIDEAAGIDTEAFYQKYQYSGNHCILTPENLWPDISQMRATATALAFPAKTLEHQPTP